MFALLSLAPRGSAQVPALLYPAAPNPPADQIIVPPQENRYFPTRADGQAFVLNEDVTVNLTDFFNRQYYNPLWRAEEWAPYQNYWIAERGLRALSTWREYDNFSVFRIFWPTNKVHKWIERYSGYGP